MFKIIVPQVILLILFSVNNVLRVVISVYLMEGVIFVCLVSLWIITEKCVMIVFVKLANSKMEMVSV